MTNFWNVRVNPAHVQAAQDAFNDLQGRLSREHAQHDQQRRIKAERDDVVAHMARMVRADRQGAPDFWAAFAVDDEALAGVIADWVLARRR